ncbi:MAG: hypothetical protein OSB21_14800, partial [Myxococcota bacterium]|nr:hypothetical protein [Myxococcota bacterium]
YGPGLLTLTAGGNIGTCIYRLAHGMTPASTRLRIVQVPGPPLTAVLTAELMEGAVRSLDNYSQSPNEWTDATSVAVTLQALDANNLAPEGLRMWLDISNCHVSQRAFELDADGRASFRVAGGGDEQADCSLRPRYFNELEQYETRAVNGRARRAGESIEEAAARSELLIETGGFAAPELISVGFGPSHSFVMESPGTAHTWQINADRDRLIYPNLLGNGDCTPAVACTQAELVAMQRNDDGVLEVRLDGNGTAQVLRDAIPLNYEFRDQGDPRIQVTLREGLMGAGRWLGLRLKHPGENGAVSNAQTFYAQPPTQWTGPGPGGAGGAVTITRPGGEVGAVTITGGWRRNLHGDATPELLLCGTDASGGWFAVVHLDENGALPSETQQAERSWSGGTYSAPYDARFACAVADLDNDGRDDLVVLAAPHNGFPSLVIHRGTDDAQVFSATGERLVWGGQDLRNTILGSLELEVGPAAVVVCLDGSLRTDRVCQTRKRLLLNLPENGAEAAGFEDLAMA